MNTYETIVDMLQKDIDSGKITLEFAESVNDLAYSKYIVEKSEKKDISKDALDSFKKKVNELKDSDNDANKKADELSKTWNYKEAISLLSKTTTDATKIKNAIQMNYSETSDTKELCNKLSTIINSNNSKIKELKGKDAKKQLNRFNNKYWIDYTKKHNQAFRETEKELLGHNTKRGINHDMDKYFMYHVLPAPIAHALHVQFSKHHKNHARTEEDYTQMMIDWECNRKTKPDKQMKPYEILDKFYPELKDTMIPILKKYGLPTNAEEDRKMSKEKKKE